GIRDLAVMTPGLYISAATGTRSGDRIALRGISTVLPTVGYVGIYIDGMFVPSGSAQALELSNVERVEIIKGPQSAIFGRSTLSGAINYVTKRPGNDWSGRVQASAGEFAHREYVADLSGPLGEQFAFLLGGRYYERDGAYRNQLSGRNDVGGQSSRSGTLGLRFTPSDTFEAYLRVLASRDADDAAAVYLQNSLANNCLIQNNVPTYYCGRARIDPNGVNVVTANSQVPPSVVVGGMAIATVGTYTDDGRAGMDRDAARAMLELNWTLGDWRLTSLSGYGAEKTRDAFDLTTRGAFEYPSTVGLPSLTFDRDIKFKDFQQELRALWDNDGRISAFGGLYYFKSKRTEFLPYRALPQADAGRLEATNTAVFGRVQFDVTQELSIAAEARYQEDKVDYFNASNFVPGTTTPLTAEAKTRRFLPRVTVDYNVTDDAMVYALFSKGNRPVTINTAPELAFCTERQ
ncbi:MAG: TonB-dependent receptor, partial [Steroidobacteraceae bacterium]|nr:TonB-dependent receptor [Steroidobacteraceae bacterium]